MLLFLLSLDLLQLHLKLYHLITKLGCRLEIQIGCCLAHLLLHPGNQLLQFVRTHGFRILLELDLFFGNRPGDTDEITDCFFNGLRRNMMLFVILLLDCPTAAGLFNCRLHGIRHVVGIHNNMSLCVTCGTSNGLDQGCLRTQKALLIRIENCNKGDLRNIQSLPQKVNTDKHIEHIKTHIPDDLCPFQCINIRMQVLHTDSHILHIIGQVLSHPLRERRYQNLIMLLRFLPDLRNQIINLSFHRTDENLRIQKSRRPDNLLCAQ